MADIILIQPSVKEFQIIKKTFDIPLSLLSVSSFLVKDYNVKIIDQQLDKDWGKKLLEELKKNPICVGLTAKTGEEITKSLKVSEIVKKNNKSTKVVWGGIHASLLPKQTLKNPNIDIIVKGEGELTFYELIKALEKNKSLKGIKGTWYKKGKDIKRNLDRPFLDLNKLPPLPYNLIKIENYLPKREGKKSINIETSRGCPYACAYCYNPIISKSTYRCLSAKNTTARINDLVEDYGISYLRIIDDNYFINKKRVLEISKHLLKEKYNLAWESLGGDVGNVSRFSTKELEILKRSGCHRVSFGIESGSQRILKLINKNLKVNQVISLNHRFKKVGLGAKYLFMFDLPTETIDDIKKTIDLAIVLRKNNNLAFIGTSCYTPIPNSQLFDLAVKEGFIAPKNLESWAKYDRDLIYKDPSMKKNEDLIINLNFAFKVFLNRVSEKKWPDFLKNLYCPIAKFRIKHLFFKFFIEKALYYRMVKSFDSES